MMFAMDPALKQIFLSYQVGHKTVYVSMIGDLFYIYNVCNTTRHCSRTTYMAIGLPNTHEIQNTKLVEMTV